jgi:hypothetical protein
MICYLIILFFYLKTIYCQQIDGIIECNNKDLTQYQLHKMNFIEQEQLVNKFFFKKISIRFLLEKEYS